MTPTKPYVVGIAGGSASGKSTLCDRLEAALSASLRVQAFHMDAYFKPRDERPRAIAPVTGIEYIDDNCPDTADLPRMHRDIEAAIAAAEADVILVEGLLVLYDDAICGLLDLKLFVDCRPDERIVRRLRRNMGWGLTFDEISSVYLDMVRYRHDMYVEPSKWRADMIVNGSRGGDIGVEMIVERVRAKVTSPTP